MDFEKVFQTVFYDLDEQDVDYALIGGFAMAALGIVRTTVDIDILLLTKDLDKTKKVLSKHYYNCIFESENVSHFVSDLKPFGQIDILHAFRDISVSMLARAKKIKLFERYEIKVLDYVDIIGLKLQALTNEPERAQSDWSDIELILSYMKEHKQSVDWELLSDYFTLFSKHDKLVILKNKYE